MYQKLPKAVASVHSAHADLPRKLMMLLVRNESQEVKGL